MENCLRCKKPLGCGQCRGLCTTCYSKWNKIVRRGGTTWDALETRGKCLKAKRIGERHWTMT